MALDDSQIEMQKGPQQTSICKELEKTLAYKNLYLKIFSKASKSLQGKIFDSQFQAISSTVKAMSLFEFDENE